MITKPPPQRHRQHCYFSFFLLLLLLFCGSTYFTVVVLALDDHDEYVRQVLEEEQQHYGYDNDYYYHGEYRAAEDDVYGDDDDPTMKDHDDSMMSEEERYLREQERLAQEQADRVAAERERHFQAELDRMDAEQQKNALRQKKKDHRKVQRVLRAAQRGDLYGVLGFHFHHWTTLKVPSKRIQLPGSSVGFTIPGITIREVTDKDIRKHFRKAARELHPDKNKDGRAQEAFMAAETAAAILSDRDQRAAYDQALQQQRAARRAAHQKLVSAASRSLWQVSSQVVKTAHTLLGPFFTSVMILLAVII